MSTSTPPLARFVALALVAAGSGALGWALLQVAVASPRDVAGTVTGLVCLMGVAASAWHGGWAVVAVGLLLVRAQRRTTERVLAVAPRLVRRIVAGAAGTVLVLGAGTAGMLVPAVAAPVPDDLGYRSEPALVEPTEELTPPGAGSPAPTSQATPQVIPPGSGEKRSPSATESGPTAAPATAVASPHAATPVSARPEPAPSSEPPATPGATAPTMSSGAPEIPVSSSSRTPSPSPTASPPPQSGTASTAPSDYVVQPGDTLWDIARDHGAQTNEQIAQAWPRWYDLNRDVIGQDPNLIEPGQVLAIPSDGATR